jgi:arylsulfatase A-like enzyme
MKINAAVRSLLLLLSLLLFLSACRKKEQPNVLLIIVDDLGKNDLSYYGSAIYQTPNIDALAQQSLRFEQAYSNYPRCVPSRYALLTGGYPVIDGDVPDDGFSLADQPAEQQFVRQIKDQGYATAYFGKWHLGEGDRGPAAQGFEYTYAAGAAGSPRSFLHPFNTPKGNNRNVKKAPIPDVDTVVDTSAYLTDVLTQQVINYLEGRSKEKPFFACLSYYAVHQPLEGKPTDVARNRQEIKVHDFGQQPEYVTEGTGRTKMRQDNPQYAAMVENLDVNIGRLLQTLEELGLAENTVLVFTSDHGGLSNDGYNQRQLATSNFPLRAGKGWLYEGGIKVPLFVRYPGTIKARTESESVVMLMDLLPTFRAWLSPELPAVATAGRDLRPLLEEKEQWEDRTVYWHESKARPRNTGESPASAVRQGRWKLIDFYKEDRLELYDLANDPGETRNLIDSEASRADVLYQKLQEWKAAF